MKQRLHHRLNRLEAASALLRKDAAQQNSREKTHKRIHVFLKGCGVEQESHESLLETLARAVGIALRELREMLRVGIDPIQNYFTDHGIFEEIERRKAAGTWPAAGGKELRC